MSFLKNGSSVSRTLQSEFSLITNRGKCFEGILDECKRSVAKGDDLKDKDVENVIQELESYLFSQLAREEESLKRAGGPDLEERLSHYQLFRDKVRSFRQESHFSREALMMKIHQFSKKWFISHILKMDQEF